VIKALPLLLYMTKSLASLIERPKNQLTAVIKKAQTVGQIERDVKLVLDQTMACHVRIGRPQNRCLPVFVPNGSWATNIRFQRQHIIKKINHIQDLKAIQSLEIKVRPDLFTN
jgi:hypothetical protein